ncbi:MAG: glycoside hydrolase [Rhizobacter sp.]|nr:glycoside hydrolase [Ferruginibacter sp.]
MLISFTSKLSIALIAVISVFNPKHVIGQPTVIAYYYGGPETVDSFPAEKLTHIIHSFSLLKGNKIDVPTNQDSLTIKKMVALKKRNPSLKVLLAFGGWGGCETCSDVFSKKEDREAFARSAKGMISYFNADGIDLDWEFPALPGIEGHGHKPADKQNFTLLVQELRKVLGTKKEISFAAGGFKWTLNQSIEWNLVMPLVDRVNLMSYDFTRSKTGHNTALYSTTEQASSADYFIKHLYTLGVPANKIVLGAAFYAVKLDSVAAENNGLYQAGKPAKAVAFKDLDSKAPEANGYKRFWDTTAKAPYIYNERSQEFLSYDDERSVYLKMQYVIDHQLNGIMFWQLTQDKYKGGLLEAIYKKKLGQ